MLGALIHHKSNVLAALLRSSSLLVGKILAPGKICLAALTSLQSVSIKGTYKILSCIGLLRSTRCTETKIGTNLGNVEADEAFAVPLLRALRKVNRSQFWRDQINVEV